MRQIFSNAHLTIGADCAPDSQQGFLGSQAFACKTFRTIASNDCEYTLGIKFDYRYPHIEHQLLKDDLPLYKRAWAFQEKLLSPRILHFTNNEMVWECRECVLCECLYTKNPPRAGPLQNLKANNPGAVFGAWYALVSQFSALDLSVPADKLPAISGLASYFQTTLGSTVGAYVAGMWEPDLLLSLLWYVQGPGTPRRPRAYRAPSWSWASIDGRINYFRYHRSLQFEPSLATKEIICKPASELDPTGAVAEGATLRLVGEFVEVALEVIPVLSVDRESGTAYQGMLAHSSQRAFVRSCISDSYEVLCDEHMPFSDRPVGKNPWLDDQFFCLAVGTSIERRAWDRDVGFPATDRGPGLRLWWLVLKRSWKVPDGFERVGVGYCNSVRGELGCGLFDEAAVREVCLI